MHTLVVLSVVVAAAAAFPLDNRVSPSGEFVLTKDYSAEDGTEYSVKYLQPYTPGQPKPRFNPKLDSSEEVYRFLATPKLARMSWSERVNRLRQVIATGLDVSDEQYHRMYSTGGANLPPNRQYFVDASGEIYYDAGQEGNLQSETAVEQA